MEISSPSQLFQTYLKMLIEYSQRRSGLGDDTFNEVIEQLNPDLEMASKTIFDRVEERGVEQGLAIGDLKIRNVVRNLILKTSMTDAQIAETINVPISMVQDIRQEMENENKTN